MTPSSWRTPRLLIALATLLFALCGPASSKAPHCRMTYPSAESGSKLYLDYYWSLLAAALQHTEDEHCRVELSATQTLMNHRRAMEELAAGRVDIYVRAVLPPEYADRLELVPIPLDRGLLGHRISLIHKDNQARVARVTNVEELRQLAIGQGNVWVDADILASAGMNVIRSTSYEGLFPMLMTKNIEIFPRGANEVLGEYLGHREREPDLVIDSSMVIYYPLSFYFMVRKSPEGLKLKARVLEGLQRMRKDGTFNRMYANLKRQALDGVNIKGRRFIRLENHLYDSAIYAVDQKELWDRLDQPK